MNPFNIISVSAGISSIAAGIYMMRINRRAKLAFFIELAGLLLIISTLIDNNNTLHKIFTDYLNLNL